jgi:tripartite-type tricarboxylate transporter receptor subunit TctC
MGTMLERFIGIVVAAFVTLPLAAFPQSYPSRPIKMVVPFAPGGSVDLFARRIGQKLNESLGQPMVIDNTSGGVGILGAASVARSAPDGYTLMFVTVGEVLGAVFLRRDLPYDPLKDFTPLMAAVESLTLLLAHPSVSGNTLKELLDYAKRNPGKLAYASAGIGSYFHLSGELLKHDAGVDLLHVPYKSVPPSLNDLAGGQVQMAFAAVASARPYLNRVKVLAVLEATRNPSFPNVPSLSEVVPGFEKLATWFAYFGPAGLPRPIQLRLNTDLGKALAAHDVREWLDANGLLPLGGPPEQLTAMIRRGLETYAQVVKFANIKPE